MRFHPYWLVAIIGFGAFAAPSRAAIFFYDTFKSQFYDQLSETPPSSPNAWQFIARVILDQPGDITGATFQRPGGDTFELSELFPAYWSYFASAGSQAAIDAQFPGGEYTFSVIGPLYPKGASATLTQPDVNWFPDNIPTLVNGCWTRFQQVAPDRDFELEINGFTAPLEVNEPLTFVSVRDVDLGTTYYFGVFPADRTLISIPSFTFPPGAALDASIAYSARATTSSAGFDTATSTVAFDYVTYLRGRAIARSLRGDMNCDGIVDFNDIDGFVLALVGQAGYEAAYPACYLLNGDINEDAGADFDDIDPFVQCLVFGGCI